MLQTFRWNFYNLGGDNNPMFEIEPTIGGADTKLTAGFVRLMI